MNSHHTERKVVIVEVFLFFSLLQKTIKESIKEHLFGPDLVSTDENSPHSQESGEDGE